jgi:hypothetical protein
MPTSTGKRVGKKGEEERDGGIEGWFDCGGEGWREWMTVVLVGGEGGGGPAQRGGIRGPPFRAHTKLVSGFAQTEDHSLWPAGLWGWCYTATKRI